MSTNNKRGIDPAIIAAIIGVMGTLCVSLITLYANRILPGLPPPAQPQPTVVEPTWTVSSTATMTFTPVPTDTVPAGNPTSTPAPDTPTPEATLTPIPPAIGADWVNNCISILWRPYPDTVQTSANNGCLVQPVNLSEPVNLFFTENGRLKFVVTRSFESPEVFGLFALLPASGTVRVDTNLRRIQDGEIWMGVFAEPNLTSQGLVTAILPGENVRKRELSQKKMPEQVEIQRLESFYEAPGQDPPLYSVVLEFGNGVVRMQKVGETEFSAVPISSAQPWLFVGYQVTSGSTRLDGEFLNLVVQGQ
jgi:hypothetical protein